MGAKQIWCDAYEEYWNEHLDDGMTDDDLEKRAEEYANGAFERLLEWADVERKRRLEGGYG